MERVGTHAYRLKFPPSIKRHLVLQVSEIEPVSDNPLPGQRHPPPPPVVVDREQEWEVEEVLGSRRRYRKLEYKVKWVGDEETTWQPAGDLEHAASMVESSTRSTPTSLYQRRSDWVGRCGSVFVLILHLFCFHLTFGFLFFVLIRMRASLELCA